MIFALQIGSVISVFYSAVKLQYILLIWHICFKGVVIKTWFSTLNLVKIETSMQWLLLFSEKKILIENNIWVKCMIYWFIDWCLTPPTIILCKFYDVKFLLAIEAKENQRFSIIKLSILSIDIWAAHICYVQDLNSQTQC